MSYYLCSPTASHRIQKNVYSYGSIGVHKVLLASIARKDLLRKKYSLITNTTLVYESHFDTRSFSISSSERTKFSDAF